MDQRPASSGPSPRTSGRFAYVDALRGVASLCVVLFHLSELTFLRGPALALVPGAIVWLLHQGYLGVFIFFAISGFVIVHSLRSSRITPGFVGLFILRRSVRLDPPLWGTLAAAIGLAAFSAFWAHEAWAAPTPGQVLANVTYTQNLLRIDNLSVGLWTLCLEIQFYLFIAVALGVLSWRRASPTVVGLSLLVPTAIAVFTYESIDGEAPGLLFNSYRFLLPNLALFGCGYFAWLWWKERIPTWAAGVLVACVTARLVWRWSPEIAVAAATAATFAAGARLGRLATWLDGHVLQYLGKISYSLYLIHYPAGQLAKRLTKHVLGESVPAQFASFACALAGALAAAHVLHRAIEVPCLTLAHRIGRSEPAAAEPALPLKSST